MPSLAALARNLTAAALCVAALASARPAMADDPLAKLAFGAEKLPAAGPAESIGFYSKGCFEGGVGLPDPAFYTRGDAETREVMDRYRTYVRRILLLTGTPEAQAAAQVQQVLDVETRLAQAARGQAAMQDPRANYAAVPTSSLAQQYKRLQLADFLKAQGVTDDRVSMPNPGLFAALDNYVASLPVDEWKTFLRWRVGDAMAPYLSKSWRDAAFDCRGRVLGAQVSPQPRQEAVLDAINLAAGPMLGHEYVARYLPAASRTQAEQVAAKIEQDAYVD